MKEVAPFCFPWVQPGLGANFPGESRCGDGTAGSVFIVWACFCLLLTSVSFAIPPPSAEAFSLEMETDGRTYSAEKK